MQYSFMHFTAKQIAQLIDGKIEGNPEAKISKVAKIEDAKEGDLSFIANPKYEEHIYTTSASVLIVNDSLQVDKKIKPALIRVKDAYSSFAILLEKYNEIISGKGKTGIEEPSFISKTAKIGKDVYVGALSYIGENVVVGDRVRILPGCYIGDNAVIDESSELNAGVRIANDCVIGKRVVVHAGAVIGSDGFGFAPQSDRSYKKIPQIGNVVIEDDVEIGANTTIDRATMGSTIIRKGVKLDNLVQIAHNVEIGENTVIAAQTGISGSTKLGKNCVVGGQVGIVGHIQIADGTQINAQSGVSKTITQPGTAITGSPAYEYKSSLKSQAIFRNLPDLQQRLHDLEQRLKELQSLLNSQNIPVK
jgi:UDP-3-O-[3-hydroxymyristoyl] glucosamine N-acyltransferase